ncbi:MAG: hypothetical protein IJI43_00710 [Bacilli bacterium]|nr:hypothetical protein [Bacilli bacterium]
MKEFETSKNISTVCYIIGVLAALYGLILGLKNIGGLGIIFVIPSAVALIIISLDYGIIIATDKVNGALGYSIISSLIKVGCIISLISEGDYFALILIILLIVVLIPSFFNTIRLLYLRGKGTDNSSENIL